MTDYKKIKVYDSVGSDLYDEERYFQIGDDIRFVKVPKKAVEAYKDAINPDVNFLFRVRRFLAAENEAGRKAKVIKDFGTIFLPHGRAINNITDLIGELMSKEEKEKKPAVKSKTIITFGVLFVAGLLQSLGVLPESVEVAQGQEWVAMAVSAVAIAIRVIKGKDIRLK